MGAGGGETTRKKERKQMMVMMTIHDTSLLRSLPFLSFLFSFFFLFLAVITQSKPWAGGQTLQTLPALTSDLVHALSPACSGRRRLGALPSSRVTAFSSASVQVVGLAWERRCFGWRRLGWKRKKRGGERDRKRVKKKTDLIAYMGFPILWGGKEGAFDRARNAK